MSTRKGLVIHNSSASTTSRKTGKGDQVTPNPNFSSRATKGYPVKQKSFSLFVFKQKKHKSSTSTTTAEKSRKVHPVIHDSSTSTTTTKELTTTAQVIQKDKRPVLSIEIDRLLNDALQKSYDPDLKNELCYYERLEGGLKEYGDYICFNILRVCEILRSKDPNLFCEKRGQPQSIAKEIMRNFRYCDMIKELKPVDVGFLTFRLDGGWMAERIRKYLKDGIVAWAPILPVKRVIVDSSSQDIDAKKQANGVRSIYIRDMLVHMLEYCEVEVSGKTCNEESLNEAEKYVGKGKGKIKKRRQRRHNFIVKEEALRNTQPTCDHEDLAALWYGVFVQKLEWIVYVTPRRQREYIEKRQREYIEHCFNVENAKSTHEDPLNPPTMSYLGYQTTYNEYWKLDLLWDKFENPTYKSMCDFHEQGYTPQQVFECTIKYAYLKEHKYSDCKLEVEEMLSKEGNTFVYLLKTLALIRSITNESSETENSSPEKALVDEERELGLHLLQFTEVIEESLLTLMPHLLCKYLYDLSNNFTSYNDKVKPKARVLLCNAAKVVMEKGFDLLGITPESSKGLPSNMKLQPDKAMSIQDHYIKHETVTWSTSRFELFSMFIVVSHSNFEKGNLFGDITVSDTCGLLSYGWKKLDKNGCGHVAYFDHDWLDSVGIYSASELSFGNPGSRHSVPLSPLIKIGVHLVVTTEKKDACYQLCNCDEEIELSELWNGKESVKRGTFYVEDTDGSVSIYYILLKNAVDTSMSLKYEPIQGHPKVCGHILAYYGGDDVGFSIESYKAVVFHIEPSKLEKGNLPLIKSALAVPVNGVLMIEAFLKDVDSGIIIVNATREYRAKHAGSNNWLIKGKTCRFNLTVDWIGGQG